MYDSAANSSVQQDFDLFDLFSSFPQQVSGPRQRNTAVCECGEDVVTYQGDPAV